MFDRESDEKLFRRLQRAVVAARTAKPDGDRFRSGIGIAKHPIPKITRPPQMGLHLGRRFSAALRTFDRGQQRFARRLPA